MSFASRKTFLSFVPLLFALLWVNHTQAAPATALSVVNVAAPAINCVFDNDCTISPDETSSAVTFSGATGSGSLLSRLFPVGEAGTQAEGLYGYLYRLELRNVVSASAAPCVYAIWLDFGPIVPLDYDGNGSAEDIFIVTSGALGNVNVSSATQTGDRIYLSFNDGICGSAAAGMGDSSFFIGLTSERTERTVSAELFRDVDLPTQSVDAKAPELPDNSVSGTAFVHKATATNSSGHITTIDHPSLNGNPDAKLLVTQNWNPGGVGGTYNDHVIGVYYAGGFWRIFNQDLVAMPNAAAFNVLLADDTATTFVHTHTSSNDGYNETWLNNPLTNNQPNNLVFTTKNWNPNGASGVYNNFPTQVGYSTQRNEWAIVKEQSHEFIPMPTNAAFNVLVTGQDANAFVHTATSSNISTNQTTLDHPDLNDNPDAIFFVEARWNFADYFGATRENLGVWYNGTCWIIFNQGLEAMVDSAEFNILIPTTTGVPTSVGLGQMTARQTAPTVTVLLALFIVMSATLIVVKPQFAVQKTKTR